jgi:peroxiredoxin Q/BCP
LKSPAMTLNPGDRAPDFDLPTDHGRVSLAALKGKPVILYFYPKDDTTGCTAEAQGFSGAADAFAKAGVTVVGVSKDSVASHGKFRSKYDLKIELGSAKEDDVVERYGAWIEKSMYGRKYMGIDRSTFLIDKAGVIRRVWRKVKGGRPRRRSPGRGSGIARGLTRVVRRAAACRAPDGTGRQSSDGIHAELITCQYSPRSPHCF